jgi:glycosyltransferase involved in cell wall biosynthesis
MGAVDVVLHTAEAPEPFGRVILEGMLAGKPVVATRAGGAVEIVEDGVTGVLVSPGDVSGFVSAVGGLLANPARRATFGMAAFERASREFTLKGMLAGLDAEIAGVVGDGRSR